MRNGKWMFQYWESDIWSQGNYYDTRQEAIAGALAAETRQELGYGYDGAKTLYIGQVSEIEIKICADEVIDILCEKLYEQCELAGDWADGITREEKELLDDMLDRALHEWLDKTNNHPGCFGIQNIEKVDIV